MHNCDFNTLLQEMFIERWLSPKTQESYAGPVGIFQRYVGLHVLPGEVTRRDVLNWRRSIVISDNNPDGIQESSWNNYVRHLKAIYRFGISHELIPLSIQASPFEQVFLREKKRRRKTLQDSAIVFAREALEQCRRQEVVMGRPASIHPAWFWRVVVETFYHTGIRLNQLLSITPDDVHLNERILVARAEGAKNSYEAVLPITGALYPYLATLMEATHVAGCEHHGQLFNVNLFSVRTKRERMNSDQVKRFFNQLSRYCGTRISPHRFRHTLATDLMRSKGRDVYLTQQVCGHTDLRSTMQYINPDVDTLREYLEQRHSYRARMPRDTGSV